MYLGLMRLHPNQEHHAIYIRVVTLPCPGQGEDIEFENEPTDCIGSLLISNCMNYARLLFQRGVPRAY